MNYRPTNGSGKCVWLSSPRLEANGVSFTALKGIAEASLKFRSVEVKRFALELLLLWAMEHQFIVNVQVSYSCSKNRTKVATGCLWGVVKSESRTVACIKVGGPTFLDHIFCLVNELIAVFLIPDD